MTAREWIDAFAAELGLEPPSDEQVDSILELAGTAAHSSERIAAPVACWLAAQAGASLDEVKAIAERVGAGG